MSSQLVGNKAVLVYGPKKAGTSLLHNLLDGGGELLMMPGELKLLSRFRRAVNEKRPAAELIEQYLDTGRLAFPQMFENDGRDLRANSAYQFDGLSHEQMNDLFDLDRYANRLGALRGRSSVTYGELVEADAMAFAEALSAQQAYHCHAAKEVAGKTEAVIDFFRENFANHKIVFLARDPDFITRSIILDRRRKGIRLNPRQIWYERAKAQRVLHYIFRRGFKNGLVVAYEHLTQNTEAQMRRVAEYLEIPFESVLCVPTTLGVPAVVRTSSKSTTEVFRSAQSWKKDLSPLEVASISFYKVFSRARRKKKSGTYFDYQHLLEKIESSIKGQ